MSLDSELNCAYRLDGQGMGHPIDWSDVKKWTPDQGVIWIDLDCTHANTETWLRTGSGLDSFVVDGMMIRETRPRCETYNDGVLVVLRGVNLRPDANPEDMVSIRIWVDDHRVISTRYRHLMAIEDLRNQLTSGKGPVSAGHLVARFSGLLTDRMGPVIEDLGEQVSDLEDWMIEIDGDGQQNLRDVRFKLAQLRRTAIALRRYIAPQRDALNRLSMFDEVWIDDRTRGRLRETVDRVTRITEELDDVRERSALIQDELTNRISQRMERTMYVLTVVATIMLPLGFLTGLLGINVGGIPGAETKWAFWAVCGGLITLVAAEVTLFKKFKWL